MMKKGILHLILLVSIPVLAMTIFISAKTQERHKNFQSGFATNPKTDLSVSDKAKKDSVHGLHLFTCAHSFHNFMPKILADIAQSAGIKGHVQFGTSMIGGSRVIQHWKVSEGKNIAKSFLSNGKIDVLTLSPIWLPDSGIQKFGEFAVMYNPQIRIMVQEFWIPNDKYEPVFPYKTKEKVDHNAATIPGLKKQQDLYCRVMQHHLDSLNSRAGRNIYFLVPVGHAVIALREKVIKNKAPGLHMQDELFADNWGHPKELIKVLSAYCFYACIYQQSPVGLPVPANLKKEWDPKLIRLLQELAWQAVKSHPLTGLTKNK